MDLNVWIHEREIRSDLYCKPTDCHQYLSFHSCHPYHVKRAIIYGQALRVKTICSSTEDFEGHMEDMKTWFLEREYPSKLIDEQIAKARRAESGNRTAREPRKEQGPVLVATYHPALDKINKILSEHFHILQIDQEMKKIFERAPMVAYRNPKALRNTLVRAKLTEIEEAQKGSFKCKGRRCQICDLVKECDTFSSYSTGETFHINFHLDCNSKCIIYLLNCRMCSEQLVGVCTTCWRDRWSTYLQNMRKAQRGEHHMQKEVHAHFKLPGHTSIEKDVDIIFIDKTDPMDPKKREKFWISRLDTMVPKGLNVSETM